MKHTKKLLAILLTFVLALTLGLPAFAEVNWDDFRFTKGASFKQIVKHGKSFTIFVEVNIPDGVDRVEYQWYRILNNKLIEGATTATLQLSPNDPDYPNSSNSRRGTGGYLDAGYECVVTGYADGDVILSKTLKSGEFSVSVEGTFGDKLYSITISPFVEAHETLFPFYIIFPILYPLGVFSSFLANLTGLIFGAMGLA